MLVSGLLLLLGRILMMKFSVEKGCYCLWVVLVVMVYFFLMSSCLLLWCRCRVRKCSGWLGVIWISRLYLLCLILCIVLVLVVVFRR